MKAGRFEKATQTARFDVRTIGFEILKLAVKISHD
jgi:hypothetical protein